MNTAPLTSRQRSILAAVRFYLRTTGEPCTAGYLARRFSLDHSTVIQHLELLHAKGYLMTSTAPALPTKIRAGRA